MAVRSIDTNGEQSQNDRPLSARLAGGGFERIGTRKEIKWLTWMNNPVVPIDDPAEYLKRSTSTRYKPAVGNKLPERKTGTR